MTQSMALELANRASQAGDGKELTKWTGHAHHWKDRHLWGILARVDGMPVAWLLFSQDGHTAHIKQMSAASWVSPMRMVEGLMVEAAERRPDRCKTFSMILADNNDQGRQVLVGLGFRCVKVVPKWDESGRDGYLFSLYLGPKEEAEE